VAARLQPTNLRRRSIVLAIVAIVALGLPAIAGAHSGTLVNALDYRARVTSAGTSGTLTAAIIDGDRKLELRVPAASTVVVLGFAGEPFLRFTPTGVDVNERSPSAIATRLARRGSVPALDSKAAPSWSRVANDHRFAWHDHRLGPQPGRSYPEGNVAAWTIPIVVDGHAEAISGRLLHASGPPLWPWLVLLAVTVVVGAALVTRGRKLVEQALYAAAAIAGGAAVVLAVSFAFVPGRSTSTAWTNVLVCCLIALAAIALFVRAPGGRHAVAGFIAVLAALVGLSEASVLTHGFVISSLPAASVRAATAAAVSAGAIGAACATALLLRDGGRQPRRPRGERMRVEMAVPRGRSR
jgi:hypothetical protein